MSATWAEIRATAEAALELPPEERAAFLDRSCAGRSALRAEVEAHIRACERAARSSDFLAGPAAAFAAPLLEAAAGHEDPASREAGVEAALRAALSGRYDVERELGRGGMATVYLARDRRHERPVAVKVLDGALGATISAGRFLREIRVTARLTHPHIVPLHDSGRAAGLLYYVMPYVEGETLRERLGGGPLSLEEALRLMREVADALAYAHRRGVVHRDVKPANILLEDGHAVVADFGIARAVRRAREIRAPGSAPGAAAGADTLTDAGTAPGTPAYMAPEQARVDGRVDHRADLHALGVVAYEALTGVHPFGARPPHARVDARPEEAPAPLAAHRPDVPPALDALVLRLLSADPDARPQSATEVVAALDAMRPRWEPAGARRAHAASAWKVAGAVGALLLTASGGLLLGTGSTAHGGTVADRGVGSAPAPTHGAAVQPVERAGESMADSRRGTRDQEAYDLYLAGRYYFLQRGPENVARAIRYFRRAIARDPSFARAHAGLAMAYSTLPLYLPDPTDSATALTVASAERAVALDSTLADAQLALAIALDMRLRFREGLSHYREAVARDPTSATAHHWLGLSLLNLGRTDEALVELHHATELDPLAPSAASAVALALLAARRYSDAMLPARHSVEVDSSFVLGLWTLGVAQALGGQPDSAVATLERGVRLHPDDARLASALVLGYAVDGRWADAGRLRARLHRPGSDSSGGIGAAFADLVFGDAEPLTRLLTSESGQRRYMEFGVFGCNPMLDPLQADARFRAAMRRLTVEPCPLARPWPLPARPRRQAVHPRRSRPAGGARRPP